MSKWRNTLTVTVKRDQIGMDATRLSGDRRMLIGCIYVTDMTTGSDAATPSTALCGELPLHLQIYLQSSQHSSSGLSFVGR